MQMAPRADGASTANGGSNNMNTFLLASLLAFAAPTSQGATAPHLRPMAIMPAGGDAVGSPAACGVMVIRHASGPEVRVPIIAVLHMTLNGTHQFWAEGFSGNTSYMVVCQNVPLSGVALGALGSNGPAASLSVEDGTEAWGNPTYPFRYETFTGGFGDGAFSYFDGRSVGHFRFQAAKPGDKKPDITVDGVFDSH